MTDAQKIILEAAQKHGLTFDHAYYCRKGTNAGGRDLAGWTAQTNRGQFCGPTSEAVVAEIARPDRGQLPEPGRDVLQLGRGPGRRR